MSSIFSGSAGRNAAIAQANLGQYYNQSNQGVIANNEGMSLDAQRNAFNTAAGNITAGTQSGLAALLQGYNTAAGAVGQGYGSAINSAASGYGAGNAALQGGLGASLGALYGGVGQAAGDISRGANTATGNIRSGLGASLGAVNQGYGAAQNTLNANNALFQPFLQNGTAAQGLLSGALGANGAAGSQAAQAAFQSAPGYQYQVDQALDAVNRNAAATGAGLASGNTLAALQNRGNDLANQNWQQWLTNLSGESSAGQNAAASVAANNTNLAQNQSGQGQAQSGLITGAATNLGNVATQAGNNLGNLFSSAGTQAAGLNANAATALNTNDVGAGNAIAGYQVGQGTALGNLASSLGTQSANLDTSQGTQLANLAQNYGNDQQNIFTNATNQAINANLSAQNIQSPAIQSGYLAGQQANQTLDNAGLQGLGGLLSVASLGTGGGQTLGGGLLKSLGSSLTG